jgi:hypothetical protein
VGQCNFSFDDAVFLFRGLKVVVSYDEMEYREIYRKSVRF